MDPRNTTVLFVPGGWHSPECFDLVAKLLRDAGYQTEYAYLPSVGPKDIRTDLQKDSEAIRQPLAAAVEKGQDVVVFVHSYGGVPSQDAIHGLEKATRSKQGQSGGVIHLIYCASFIIQEGNSVVDALGGQHLPWYRLEENGTLMIPNTPEATFYGDLSPEHAKEAAARLKPHCTETSRGKIKYAAWKHVPSTYFYCLKDEAVPHPIQQMMVEQIASGAGIKMNTVTFDSAHSPFYSIPEETAKAIRQAAGESI